MHAYDKRTGVIFFSQVATNAIACWNTAKPLKVQNIGIIARDDTTMIYPADINVSFVPRDCLFRNFVISEKWQLVLCSFADRCRRYHLDVDEWTTVIQLRAAESQWIQLSHLDTIGSRGHSKHCVRCCTEITAFAVSSLVKAMLWHKLRLKLQKFAQSNVYRTTISWGLTKWTKNKWQLMNRTFCTPLIFILCFLSKSSPHSALLRSTWIKVIF